MKHLINKSPYFLDTKLLLDEAKKYGIKTAVLDYKENIIELEYQKKFKYLLGERLHQLPYFSYKFCHRKGLTYRILGRYSLPIPKYKIATSLKEAFKALGVVGYPCVVKATSGTGGFGVFTLIETKSRFEQSARQALQKSKRIIIESHLMGHDYRLLATPQGLIHAVKRIPARVFGDGKSSIKQLITRENSKPWRGERFRQELVRIKFDEETKYILHKQGKNINSVAANGEEVFLKNCCNQCKGGEVETVPNVHPEFAKIATVAAKALEVPLAGVDLIAKDITVPVKQGGGKIIEVNENPGIQIHQIPTYGQGVNIAKIILELLFDKKFD